MAAREQILSEVCAERGVADPRHWLYHRVDMNDQIDPRAVLKDLEARLDDARRFL